MTCHKLLLVINTTNRNSNGEELTEIYIKTLKNPTRSSIFYQLTRKPEMTATEISRALGEDVDVVYYHMKFLKKLDLVSEPRVQVRGNYLEKYYSLTPKVRKSLAEADRKATNKMKEMAPEEFRQVLLTAFALIKSAVVSSANSIEKADAKVINGLNKKRNFSIEINYCTKERYYELLKDLKKIEKPPDEKNDYAERGYTIALLAMPNLNEE